MFTLKLPQQKPSSQRTIDAITVQKRKVTPSPYSPSVFFCLPGPSPFFLVVVFCLFLFFAVWVLLGMVWKFLTIVFPHRWGHLLTSRDSLDDVGNDILTKSPFLRQVAYMSPYTFDPCVGFFSKQLCVVSIHICLMLVDKDML